MTPSPVTIANVHIDGPAPEADAIYALLPDVPLAVQKVYATGRDMADLGEARRVVALLLEDGVADIEFIALTGGGLTVRNLSSGGWRNEMLADAARIAFGDSPKEHDEVRVETDIDDGYDPTYGDYAPRFTVHVELWFDGALVDWVIYDAFDDVDRFLKALLASPGE